MVLGWMIDLSVKIDVDISAIMIIQPSEMLTIDVASRPSVAIGPTMGPT